MNTRTAVCTSRRDAAIERLDAIAHTVKAFPRVWPVDRDLESQHAILVDDTDRRLGPTDADDSASTQDQ